MRGDYDLVVAEEGRFFLTKLYFILTLKSKHRVSQMEGVRMRSMPHRGNSDSSLPTIDLPQIS